MINITDKEFEELSGYIKKNYGINLGMQKQTLLVARLQNVLAQMGFSSFSQYYSYITSDASGNALTTLVDKVTTNHTFFMREAAHFDYFRNAVLPYLISTVKDKDLRIWSAGCSTGEEPYTLAMLMQDYFGSNKAHWNTRILATDISAKVLEIAAEGKYTNEHISNIPLGWKLNYFQQLDGEYSALTDKIRNEVIYRKFNLMNELFPFKRKFHVIFCRNVMIYFDAKTKNDLIQRFYDFTEPGGYLFVGHSEAVDRTQSNYKYIMPAVYRKV